MAEHQKVEILLADYSIAVAAETERLRMMMVREGSGATVEKEEALSLLTAGTRAAVVTKSWNYHCPQRRSQTAELEATKSRNFHHSKKSGRATLTAMAMNLILMIVEESWRNANLVSY